MINLKLHNLIKEYALNCIRFNDLLISQFNLNNKNELENTDYFVLPLRAYKLRIIENKKKIKVGNGEQLEYQIHGTGITFIFNNINYSFEYFPRIDDKSIPIFSISTIYEYIKIIYKNIEQEKFIEIINNLVSKELIIKTDESGFSFYLPDLKSSENIIQ
ncbi:hypothetical protein SD427_14180 [Chryseobacterium sp. JJR-5R]|uniref:DUF6896 domain-containing protein n=1 Tax=Chryseobacterium sp. JJR-5R TaxID=3093923 RepID=UPI002A7522ED|nr:hypothetical protein [Chryseobacterium sp. JJR-5R]WPO81907.1 hypothetical protein SD427_14180 [Chryseobacterium sp. JJR-5R]